MDTMDFKDALRSIIKPHNEDPLERLTTPFGEALSKDKVLTEYPRPQFERPSYINLNGLWDYAIQPPSPAALHFLSLVSSFPRKGHFCL